MKVEKNQADIGAGPTKAQLEILQVIWKHGPATVRFVNELLNQQKEAVSYTSTLKLMQIMAGKGLLLRDETQRAHIYEAAKPREWTQQQLAGDLLERAFSGSAAALLIGALSARKATKAELTELRRLLDGYRKGQK